MKSVEKFFKGFIYGVILVFAIYGFVIFTGNMLTPKDVMTVKVQKLDFLLAEKPTQELVWEALLYYKVKHPEIVLSQAILETGRFKSKVCVEKNNLFGLWNTPKARYFKFTHWSNSIKAYVDSVQYRCGENEDYYDFLNRIGYAEDPDYRSKLKAIEENLNIEEVQLCK